MTDVWALNGRTFHSRLIVGTGKYKSLEETRAAIIHSGAEMVTVAVRRIDPRGPSLLAALPREQCIVLPNTAGCYTAEEAIRTARLARELDTERLLAPFIKLEVIGDPKTLFPDNEETFRAAKQLIQENFCVLPYVTDDPVMCKKMADIGCAAVMPLAAPIGSGLGLRNPHNLRIILETVSVPVIVDAGVGTASDAAVVMELGCTAVLMNTGIAEAKNPQLMAEAMRDAVVAGRKAFLAGRMTKRLYASASTPMDGRVE